MTDTQVIEEFVENVERIRNHYEARIVAWLTELAERLTALGWECRGPNELEGDDFRWFVNAQRPGTTEMADTIDVTMEIPEGPSYGDDEPPLGVSLGVNIVEYGGRILGEYQPYNFTEQCWVDASDDAAIAERFRLVLDHDMLLQLVDFITEEC